MHIGNPERPTEGAPSASASGRDTDPVADARRLIADHEQARMQACAQEIEAVLARHGMRLDVTPAQISIVPA